MPQLHQKLLHPDQAAAVTPHDTNALANHGIIFVGTGGHVNVITAGGNTVLFKNVPSGSFLPVLVSHVKSTSTTALDLVVTY